MYVFKTVVGLTQHLAHRRALGETIGFAPTMGALHSGHLTLLQHAKVENSCSVCSIFVNPTQFNVASDLEKYPRLPEKDIELLLRQKTDILFLPSVEEVYPPDLPALPAIELGQLTTVMEGAYRPGHFDGVLQVMHRLLTLVRPDRLYMGQKDFQQFTIVQKMLEQLPLPTVLIPVETVREADGLAMSSRNMRLTPEQRTQASFIYKTLQWAKQQVGQQTPAAIEAQAKQQLESNGFQVDYFTLADAQTLQPIELFDSVEVVVACTAAWLGDVRLIDNLVVKGELR